MWVLVDYDNVPPLERARGLSAMIWEFLARLDAHIPVGSSRVDVRLYSGWYLEQSLSQQAQDVSNDINLNFPKIMDVNGNVNKRVIVDVKVAASLLADPKTILYRTYRPRQPSGIKSVGLPFPNCLNTSSCQLQPVDTAIQNKKCPDSSCPVRIKDILYRAEQKLVDSMLVSDMGYLAVNGSDITIVSSDDDVWPGIVLAFSRNIHVIQLHNKPGQAISHQYKVNAPTNYTEITK